MPPATARRTRLEVTTLEDRTTPAYTGGLAVATGDLNGDGYTDIVTVPTQGAVHVKAVSGKDGTDLFSFFAFEPAFTGGGTVAVGDVDGTGRKDIIVGAAVGGGPRVVVFNGRTGEMTHSFFAYDPSFRNGVSVAAGDLYGTGRDDLITGAGIGGGPHVKVFDARTGETKASFFAMDVGFRGGVNVAAGNVTGDGRARLIAGAGAGGGPQVVVFDTPGGTVLRSFFAGDPNTRGGVNVAAGDTEGKGRDNIVTGAGAGNAPRVRTYDGLSGALDADFFPLDWQQTGGANVATGRFGGNGRADVLSAGQSVGEAATTDTSGGTSESLSLSRTLGSIAALSRKIAGDALGRIANVAAVAPYADAPASPTGFALPPQNAAISMPLRVVSENLYEGSTTLHFGLTTRGEGTHTVTLYQSDAQGRLRGPALGTMTVGQDARVPYDVLGVVTTYGYQQGFSMPAGTWYFAAVIDGDTARPSVGSVIIKAKPKTTASTGNMTIGSDETATQANVTGGRASCPTAVMIC